MESIAKAIDNLCEMGAPVCEECECAFAKWGPEITELLFGAMDEPIRAATLHLLLVPLDVECFPGQEFLTLWPDSVNPCVPIRALWSVRVSAMSRAEFNRRLRWAKETVKWRKEYGVCTWNE